MHQAWNLSRESVLRGGSRTPDHADPCLTLASVFTWRANGRVTGPSVLAERVAALFQPSVKVRIGAILVDPPAGPDGDAAAV